MRKFFSTSVPCQAGCQYCFAKWDKMYLEFPQLENEQLSEKEAIIYPCCDGDFFAQQKDIEYMRRIAGKADKVCFSISTKRFISDEEISRISQFNQELVSANKGFVKLAISLSNMSMIEEIEPGTIPYLERLALASKLKKEGLFFSLTIKPILPFIPAEEYCEIINDFSKYTKYFLIGGLYINRESDFYSHYINQASLIQRRVVEWLPGHPEWDYIEDNIQFQRIREYAKQKELLVFDSDADLVKFYIGQRC